MVNGQRVEKLQKNYMAVFTPTIRTTKDFNPVYIRISHNSKTDYIKTGMTIHKSGLRKGKITNSEILAICALLIKSYHDKINNVNVKTWTVQELRSYLENESVDISFTDFAKQFINRLINDDRTNSAYSYKRAVKSLNTYLKKDEIFFNELTSKVISGWIDSMRNTKRAKSMYPSLVKTIFKAGLLEYNDYDYNIIKIRVNPFVRVKIPKQHAGRKKSIETEIVNKILTANIVTPLTVEFPRKELAQAVAKLIFCLAGINAADLYDMNESALKKNWKLCYHRKKTRDRSDTGAYIEITVPEVIRPLFDQYKGVKGKLFIFSKRYSDGIGFVKGVNMGLKQLCDDLQIEKVTTYTFRHSWATIAQNECGASTEMVAFALNHAPLQKVTEGYIRKDYSPIDRLNQQVIDCVFTRYS